MAGRPVKHGSQVAEEYELLVRVRHSFYFWIKKSTWFMEQFSKRCYVVGWIVIPDSKPLVSFKCFGRGMFGGCIALEFSQCEQAKLAIHRRCFALPASGAGGNHLRKGG